MRRLAALLLCLPALAACTERGSAPSPPTLTPLDAYVLADDPAYRYEVVNRIEGPGYVADVLRLTTQRWLDEERVDRPEWWHWLTVIRPEVVESEVGMLYISGGRNFADVPTEVNAERLRYALATGSVVADLRMVPNQPLKFTGEERTRREDALVAYGWHRFLTGGEAEWLPRLPMTKSAVRAMDAVTEYCKTPEGGGIDVDRFVVAGRSKRGWTTWTTAAVDSRVVGIVPIVIDLLNLEATFLHHYRSYGSWSPAIDEYVALGIPDWLGTERMEELRAIVEPYEYRARLTMPKLLLNGAGDEFFVPDASRFYFDNLPGETYLRYVPNTGHAIGNTDALDSLLAFYRTLVEGRPRPDFDWSFEEGGAIRVTTEEPSPTGVRLWQAANATARDFRVTTIGESWTSTVLAPEADGSYLGKVESPATGWAAFFVELTYDIPGEEPLKFTSGVGVLPDDLPYELPAAL